MRHRISRLLAAALFLSLVLHFLFGPLLLWLFGVRMKPLAQPAPEVLVMRITSSSIRHATRPKPHRAHLPVEHPVAQPQPARRQPPQHAQPRPEPREARREIARFDPRSIHPPPAHAISINAAQAQEAMYERTIAKLRAQNNPLVSAARPVSQPAAPRHYSFDFSGVGTAPDSEGILTPVQSWHDGGYDYYYVRYWVQYADGSTETGVVPWPLRYRPSQDPFRLGLEHFPLPAPLPDYVLPGGTNLHPLVAFCYEHREEFPSCPIRHD